MTVGRPVRFIAGVVGGWTALRLALVLPGAIGSIESEPGGGPPAAPDAVHHAAPSPRGTTLAVTQTPAFRPAATTRLPPLAFPASAPVPRLLPAPKRSHAFTPLADAPPFADSGPPPPAPGRELAPGEPGLDITQPALRDRWAGAAWLLWRHGDGSSPLARGGRLGDSQVGIRIDHVLDGGSPLRPTLYARLSSALSRPAAAEVAAGIALRPSALPALVLAVERREALSRGGRKDFAVMVAGGVDRLPVGPGLRVDGYAQAGVVGLGARDGFVDGRLSLEREVASADGHAGDLALGLGLWGGAQPGLSRLDIGPQATMRLPMGGAHARLTAEWRARIAGNAAPPSGAALTLGLDF